MAMVLRAGESVGEGPYLRGIRSIGGHDYLL